MVANKKKTPARTRPRAEVAAEMNSIATAAAKTDCKAAAIKAAKDAEVVGRVNQTKITEVPAKIAALGVEIQANLATVAAGITETLRDYAEARQAVAIAEAELAALHDKDVVATSLATLLEDYQKHVADIEVAKRENAEARAKADAEYNYQLGIKRRADEDTYAQRQLMAKRAEADRVAALEAAHAQREANIVAQEAEVVRLRAVEAGLESAVDSAVKKAIAIESNRLDREFTHKTELRAAEDKAARELAAQKLAQVTAENTRLVAQLAAMEARVQLADNKVAEIAKQAVEGASGQQALERMTNLMAQGNSTGGTKPGRA